MPKNFSYPAKNSSVRLSKVQRIAYSVQRLSQTTLNSIRLALKEDLGRGDITTDLLIFKKTKGKAFIVSKQKGIFCGEAIAAALAKTIKPSIQIKCLVRDGENIHTKQKVMELRGSIPSILKVERTLLNFIAHLSGIAGQTSQFVYAVRGTNARILDTRKTTPLWRELEKTAVLAGGGANHRFGLFDYILVKENHRRFGNLDKLRTAYSVQRTKKRSTIYDLRGTFEVEVRNFDELMEAFDLGAEVAMLDHFTPAQAKKAVQLRNRISPQTFLEASGNMTLKTVRAYAVAGVDTISVGVLTHSVMSHDFSLLIA